MAQASQCSQFLPSKDEEQSRAMYAAAIEFLKSIHSVFRQLPPQYTPKLQPLNHFLTCSNCSSSRTTMSFAIWLNSGCYIDKSTYYAENFSCYHSFPHSVKSHERDGSPFRISPQSSSSISLSFQQPPLSWLNVFVHLHWFYYRLRCQILLLKIVVMIQKSCHRRLPKSSSFCCKKWLSKKRPFSSP